MRRTDLGTDRAVFGPAHEHQHHHLVCESCGAVAHVHDDALGGIASRIEKTSGVRLGGREVTLFNLCRACQAVAHSERAKGAA